MSDVLFRVMLWLIWVALVVALLLLWGVLHAGAFMMGSGLGAMLAQNSRPVGSPEGREVTTSTGES